MCSCTWTCPSYCCCCCCFFFFLFFDFLGKLCCSSFFIFSLLLSFVIFCFCFFFRRDCFSKYDFYFLINMGDCFFLSLFFFVLIGSNFFIRVYVNIYKYIFSSLHFSNPNQIKGGKLNFFLSPHFSTLPQFSILLIFYSSNQTDP